MRKNQLNSVALIGVIIALIFAGAFGIGVASKKVSTVQTYAGALAVYDAVETAADLYVTDCATGVLSAGCAANSHIVRAYSDQTVNAYKAAKVYGKDAPVSVAEALVEAVNTLNASLPSPVAIPAGA